MTIDIQSRKYKITITDVNGNKRIEYAYGINASDIREFFSGILWQEGEKVQLKAYPTPAQSRAANEKQRQNNPEYKQKAKYRTMKSQAKSYLNEASNKDLLEHALLLQQELRKRGIDNE